VKDYKLPEYDAGILTASRALADYYEKTVKAGASPKSASNYVMVDMAAALNSRNLTIEQSTLPPEKLAGLLKLIESGQISSKIAKTVFADMFESGKTAEQIVREKNLVQISDEKLIASLVDKAIAENPNSVAEFKKGKEQALGFLVGQIMKATQGKANPQLVNKLLREKCQH
jgi:aspartyl-tRNA(Asn)/glutamyl-tRNA(Gln) amidotransferase subunit B